MGYLQFGERDGGRGPGLAPGLLQRPRFGVCDNAEPAAVFAALDADLLASVLLAALAAAALVCLVFRAIRLTSSRAILRTGTRGDVLLP